jgi:hypothetical protein
LPLGLASTEGLGPDARAELTCLVDAKYDTTESKAHFLKGCELYRFGSCADVAGSEVLQKLLFSQAIDECRSLSAFV